MNCKRGQRAFIIKGPDVGLIVTTIALVTKAEFLQKTGVKAHMKMFPIWTVDKDVTWRVGDRFFKTEHASDEWLKPIRDDDVDAVS